MYTYIYPHKQLLIRIRRSQFLIRSQILRWEYQCPFSELTHEFRVNDQFSSRLHRVKIQTGMN